MCHTIHCMNSACLNSCVSFIQQACSLFYEWLSVNIYHQLPLGLGRWWVELFKWLNTIWAMTDKRLALNQVAPTPSIEHKTNVTELSQALLGSNTGHTCWMADLASKTSSLCAAAHNELLKDQCCAYNPIDWHLQQFISRRCPNKWLFLEKLV